MTTTKEIVQSGCRVAVMLLLAAVVMAGSGCALFEGTLTPADGVRSGQEYWKPPEQAWVVQPSRKTVETYDGERLASVETTEYAMPSAMRSNSFRGDATFVEQDRSYRFDRNADGDAVEFNATQVINAEAYGAGTAAQVARTEQTTQLVAAAVQTLGQVAGVYVQFLNQQGEREQAMALKQLEFEALKFEAEMAAHAEAPAEETGGAAGGE